MTRILFNALCFCVLFSFQVEYTSAQSWNYPTSKRDNIVDDYHGTKVEDPYRWLEDDNSPETKEWVTKQNELTFGHLKSIPFREKLAKDLTKVWNYERYSAPFKKKNYTFYYYNNGLQSQSVLYYIKGSQANAADKGEILIDPNEWAKTGAGALTNFDVSNDGKYAVYGRSEAGSDWRRFKVINLETKEELQDEIRWVKFSDASWQGEGFYYSRFDEPKAGTELSGQNTFQKVYYHKLGTQQSQDVLIYEDKNNPKRYYDVNVTEDERFALLTISEGAGGQSKLYYKDLKNPSMREFAPIIDNFDNTYGVIDNINDQLLVLTNYKAPRKQLVLINPAQPAPANWKVLIPQTDENLISVGRTGGKLIALTLKDVISKASIHDLQGKKLYDVTLPGLGTVSGISAKKEDTDLYFSYTSYTTPATVYKFNIETKNLAIYRPLNISFNPNDYETKQVKYKSKDGTLVPLFITYKKGTKLDGSAPTMLYAYGGFNITVAPNFSVSNLPLLDNGGIYAVANIRGGSEYGEDWHTAGMLVKKQNVFDDFIAAAEYLIANKYTNPKKLAIMGGSNGGLLVGAVMLQRPELFAVAIPRVGVLDMLRFHKFTIGWGWVSEYGSSDKKEDFSFLYKYSPLHNVKANVNYPATLVMTSDHDDRVVPAHSFKFAAELQKQNPKGNPMLARIETSAGHGAGLPTEKAIEASADVWAFMFDRLGVKIK